MTTVTLDQVAKIDRKAASEEECRLLPYVGLEHIEKDTGRFAPGYEISPRHYLRQSSSSPPGMFCTVNCGLI